VVYTKEQGDKTFVIVDAGMTDLLRPTLYQAYHPIVPAVEPALGDLRRVDVVGPICETGDWLARDRELPPLAPGDLVAVLQAGAYGYAMSSNYNGHLRPAEVLVTGDSFEVIRRRQTYADLVTGTAFAVDS
jgi:diaminopimelate decarboxylase